MEPRIVTSSAGTFSGFSEDGVSQYKGIRYAVSERFCPPVPYVYPEGVHSMVNDSPYAVQTAARLETHFNGIDYTKVPQEESCQYLSVTVPEDLSEDEKLPVMVWFHGGSYRNGGCDASCYNRTLLTKEGRIVCVGIYSRLGVLGFVRDREGN